MSAEALEDYEEEPVQYTGVVQHVPLAQITRAMIVEVGLTHGKQAKELLWDSRFSEALEVVARDRNTMWGQLREAEIHLWRYMTDESEEHKLAAVESMQRSLAIAEDVGDATSPPSFFGTFFGSEELPLRPLLFAHARAVSSFSRLGLSMLKFKDRSFVSGAYNLRKSWKSFLEAEKLQQELPAEEEDEVLRDLLHFGLGFFQLTLSLVPPKFAWLTSLLGFESNRGKGVESLTLCYNQGGANSVEAGIMLSWIKHVFLGDSEGGEAMLEEIRAAHPRSVYISLTLAGMYRTTGELNKTVQLQRDALALCEPGSQQHISVSYSLGDALFLLGEYKEALELHQLYLEKSNKTNFRAMACFKLGFCLWKEKSRVDEIPSWYGRIDEFAKNEESWDRHALRRCRDFEAAGGSFSPTLEVLIEAQWAVEAFAFDRALSLLPKERPSDPDLLALYLYVQGVSLYQCSTPDLDQARQSLIEAGELEDQLKGETWVVPYSFYHLSRMLKESDPELAKEFLLQASSSEKFDFDGRLRLLVRKEKGL